MKRWYLLQILSLILLLFIGSSFKSELNSILENPRVDEEVITGWELMRHRLQSEYLAKIYSICALLIAVFFVFMGWKTTAQLTGTGRMMIIVGVGIFFCSILILSSKSSFFLEEVFATWTLYTLGAIGLSIYGIWKYEEIPKPKVNQNHKDEILDEGM